MWEWSGGKVMRDVSKTNLGLFLPSFCMFYTYILRQILLFVSNDLYIE